MWWEVVCEKDQKLSREKAKDQLKNALNKGSKPKLMNFFNQPVPNTASLKLNIDKSQGVFSGDSNNAQRDQMLRIFCNLDKKLGKKVRKLFGVESIKEKSFLDKLKKKPDGKKTDNQTATSSLGGSTNLESSNLGSSNSNININESLSSSQLSQEEAKIVANLEDELKSNNNATTQYSNINNLLNGLDNFTKDKAKTSDEQNKIKTALVKICNLDLKIKNAYEPKKGRKPFLVAISKYLGFRCFGVKDDKKAGIIDIQDICKDDEKHKFRTWKNLGEKFESNINVKLIQKVRNLIANGLNMGSGDDLPQINFQ